MTISEQVLDRIRWMKQTTGAKPNIVDLEPADYDALLAELRETMIFEARVFETCLVIDGDVLVVRREVKPSA
jgi:hypothetical protein